MKQASAPTGEEPLAISVPIIDIDRDSFMDREGDG